MTERDNRTAGSGRSGRTGRPLVEARALRKVYQVKGAQGGFTAVDGIDFEVGAGEAFGLLGANGAGKSSTMRMIACVSPVSGGSLQVLGLDSATEGPRIRSRLGVVPQDDSVDTELTVRENLLIYGRYFGLPRKVIRERAGELLEFARLTEKADERVEALSGGMRRRLTIARALINEPEIVLLDEPTTGLDPQARHLLWERLFSLKQNGVTLILTTHYMDEAEQLCDRLVVMDGGRIVAEGSPAALIERHVTREVLELRFELSEYRAMVDKARELADRTEELSDRLLLYTDDGEATLAAVHARGITPVTALVRRASLEDVFLTLTGRSLVD
jgi:lipooligosaccharide transport system ATP-binding protein